MLELARQRTRMEAPPIRHAGRPLGSLRYGARRRCSPRLQIEIPITTFAANMSITARLSAPDRRNIYEKVLEGGRITDAEGLALYRSKDLNALGAIANVVR